MLEDMNQPSVPLTCRRWLDYARCGAAICSPAGRH
jgi:hypothetical protein